MTGALLLLLFARRGGPTLAPGRTSVSNAHRLQVADAQSLEVSQEQHRLQVEEV